MQIPSVDWQQWLSLVVNIITAAFIFKLIKQRPKEYGWYVVWILLVIHYLLFYGLLISERLEYTNFGILFGPWSATLRLHESGTVLVVMINKYHHNTLVDKLRKRIGQGDE